MRYFKLSPKIIIFQNKYGLVVFTKLDVCDTAYVGNRGGFRDVHRPQIKSGEPPVRRTTLSFTMCNGI